MAVAKVIVKLVDSAGSLFWCRSFPAADVYAKLGYIWDGLKRMHRADGQRASELDMTDASDYERNLVREMVAAASGHPGAHWELADGW